MPTEAKAASVRDSAQEYGRGVLGGLLFSLPLLFTREVWHTAFLVPPERLAAAVAISFGLLVAFNRVAGLRDDASLLEAVVDSVEEYGLGILIATGILWATGRFGPGIGLDEGLGLVIVGSLATSLGVSVGTAQLGENPEREGVRAGLWGQIIVALCGATIVAANIAPTQEVLMMAVQGTPAGLGALLLGTLLLLWLATSFAELRGGGAVCERPAVPSGIFAPVTVYAVAFAASCAFLLFFGRFDGNGLGINLRQALVLSVPAAIGASVGRALLQA